MYTNSISFAPATYEPPPPGPPKAARTGFRLAVFLAAFCLAAVPWSPLNLGPSLVYVIAAIGIRKGKAWSAYGAALFAAASWLGALIITVRLGLQDRSVTELSGATIVLGAIVWIFYSAGRALPKTRLSAAWVVLAALAFLGSQTFRGYSIPTGSMENTILVGDQVLARAGSSPPARYGLVVFRYPPDQRQTFVKRCVGLPGDRIKFVGKQLYVNGVQAVEPYVIHKTEYIEPYRDNFPSELNIHVYPGAQDMLANHVQNGEVVVPPDSFFVVGDNRDASLDSRYWGFVPRSYVIGQPWLIAWSYSLSTESLTQPWSPDGIAARYNAFFTHSRASRILTVLH